MLSLNIQIGLLSKIVFIPEIFQKSLSQHHAWLYSLTTLSSFSTNSVLNCGASPDISHLNSPAAEWLTLEIRTCPLDERLVWEGWYIADTELEGM